MSFEFVKRHTLGGVAWIVIDNQEKLNALNSQVIEELFAAMEEVAGDPEAKVVVLTGAGDKAFVAGADIGELQSLDNRSFGRLGRRGQDLMNQIEDLSKPVIAAVNGYALGGGCELAMACTLRIASSNALLGLPEVKLGLLPGYGGTQRLTRLVGSGRALHMMLTGDPINAEQASMIGLVNQVVEPEALEETVAKLAGKLAESAPLAMRGIMRAVNEGAGLSRDEGLEIEVIEFVKVLSSEDMVEGTTAFLEKRKPRFSGR
jgi:enoyl-CoA hydratase